MDLSFQEIAIRLVLATLLSGVIGIERQFRHKPAGFRTNGLVGLGAGLMTLTGILAAQNTMGVDSTRIASIVVQGIGFLGAGAIIQSAGAIRGLTTAATLWLAAGIGIACGFGFWQAALLATGLVLVLLVIFDPIDARIEEEGDKTMKFFRNGSKLKK
jgi:putative Mg2+ transporter-C (MgtC) family protein